METPRGNESNLGTDRGLAGEHPPSASGQSPAARRRWKRWGILARTDKASAILSALAILLTSGSLFAGPPGEGNPAGFILIAPLVGVVFFIALVAMFLELERNGLVRALLAIGAGVLAVTAIAYSGKVAAGRLLVAYWVPAILALVSAIVLLRGKRAADEVGGANASGQRRP